jgi:mycothiol synthase
MIRTFDPRDDEAIVALFSRLHAQDPSIDAPNLEGWRGYRAMKLFEDGRRFLVVEDDGRIVALSTLGEMHHIQRVRIFVEPAHRRRGIARRILERREAEARKEGAIAIECFIDGRWKAGLELAKTFGYPLFVHDLFLRRDASPWHAAIPENIRLRPYAGSSDDAAWVAISNATLSRDAGYHQITEADVPGFTRMPGFELVFAEESDVPIGFCHLERRGEIGYIQALAVLASHESRGVGAALLAHGIESLHLTSRCIELCTEKDNARAQRLYARAGFTLDREAFTVRKTF